MDFYFLLVVIAVLLFLIYWLYPATRQLPPCPMRPLPIVGHLLYLDKDLIPQFKRWRGQCGDIFSLFFGHQLVVVLNGYDLMKETLVARADQFSDRPVLYFDQMMGYENKGVVLSSGDVWKEQRAVSLNIMRKFGFGQNVLAERIQEEVIHYLDHLASFRDQALDIRTLTTSSTANIICSIMTGQRFEYTDQTLCQLVRVIESFFLDNCQGALLNFLPLLRYLPGNTLKAQTLFESMKEMQLIIQHLMDICRNQDPCDNFIAAYDAEMRRRISAGEETTMDESNFYRVVFDLITAGTETTSNTICSFVLYMLNYPDVQEKIFQEIDKYFGNNGNITIQERPKLTYLNATIMETQRMANVLPQSVVRSCASDVTVRGFKIPKGTLLFPNLDSVMFDDKIWESDVDHFRPERFIDESGQLKTPEQFIPFGLGRRLCLGEPMAKMALFLYTSLMIQRFKILPVRQDQPPPMKYVFGLTKTPAPYQVTFIERRLSS